MSPTVESSVLKVARADSELQDQPINPDWVLEGRPRARITEWGESPDGTTSHCCLLYTSDAADE